MWVTAKRQMNFSGIARFLPGGGSPAEPLPGVAVDVFRFSEDEFGDYHYERLNTLPVMTDVTGNFSFNLPVTVEVQTVSSGVPPYDPVELVLPESLPSLVFLISSPGEEEFIELYDERTMLDDFWMADHPERLEVPLTGSPVLTVEIPELILPASVPGDQFHFLRIGRVTRDEIGEIGADATRVGYMNSASGSFMPGIVDAPFGGRLHIGGHFGANFLDPAIADKLYYSIHYGTYSGDLDDPFDATLVTLTDQILDPLTNKRYILPTSSTDKGSWEVLQLGPFNGMVTASSTAVKVYKRPGLYQPLIEYYPFWDLIVNFDSEKLPDGLNILAIKVYKKAGGTDTSPQLEALPVAASANGYLPLMIDNRPPVPRFLPYEVTDVLERKFQTGEAHFLGVPESVTACSPMGVCNEMEVVAGYPADGNECILTRYSVEDDKGSPHKHLRFYRLSAQFSPKAGPGVPDASDIDLKDDFSGYEPVSDFYPAALTTPPEMTVHDFHSVVVPALADKWPPEPAGDMAPQCPQYALEVSLHCGVRTINGWSRLFSNRHVSRHLILRKA